MIEIIHIDEQIRLKQLELKDAEDIFKLIDSQRPYFGKWLPFVEYTKVVQDTVDFVKAAIDQENSNFEYIFTIQSDKHLIGLIGFKGTDNANKKTEIGYWLSGKYQKQGIITKSVKKLCDFAFTQLNLHRIQIRCATENLSSRKIPERLGFVFEGIERAGELLTGGIYADLAVYSKLKSDK